MASGSTSSNERLDWLVVYVLTYKQRSYSQSALDKAAKRSLSFDGTSDILDFTDLMKHAVAPARRTKLPKAVVFLASDFTALTTLGPWVCEDSTRAIVSGKCYRRIYSLTREVDRGDHGRGDRRLMWNAVPSS